MTFDELLALRPAGRGNWTAAGAPQTDEPRLYGGLLLAQAIVASSARTRRCHSLHALFISVGGKQEPSDIAVEATRDGGSFSTRRVEIRQGQRLLLTASLSHHDGDDGPEHQVAVPSLPPPESLEDQRISRARRDQERGTAPVRYLAEEMLDVRPVELPLDRSSGGVQARRACWFRPRDPVEGGPETHRAVIAFASDLGLVRVGLRAHVLLGDGGRLQAASLDHAMWFHREARADDWLVHVQHANVTANGRGLAHAEIFTREGVLVATAAQEFLCRRYERS